MHTYRHRTVLALLRSTDFEKLGNGRTPKIGDTVELDTYPSKSEALRKRLDGHGDLVVATVRADKLWVLTVLLSPKKTAQGFVGEQVQMPIRHVPKKDLRQLKFDSFLGLTLKPGKLAASLRTPRVLLPSDVAILLGTKPPPTKQPRVR